jgi:hypothetical protein
MVSSTLVPEAYASPVTVQRRRGDVEFSLIWSMGVCLFKMISGHEPFRVSIAQYPVCNYSP